jgi:hypothetical protein
LASRRRLFPLGIAAVGLAVYFFLAPRAPTEQAVRIVLGDAAPRVVDLDVRYVYPGGLGVSPNGAGASPDLTREVTFHYAPGAAPRIVSHEPKLANGDYLVQMEFGLSPASSGSALPDATPRPAVTVERYVTLSGGSTSIDVSRALLARPSEER